MEDYKKLAKELIEDHITDTMSWDKNLTREDVLEALKDDTQDVFGNLSGSRTCNTYEAQQFIDKSHAIWDDGIISLYSDMGDSYLSDTLARGAEIFDVVTLELLSYRVIDEMLAE
jgi:hypothetical protein